MVRLIQWFKIGLLLVAVFAVYQVGAVVRSFRFGVLVQVKVLVENANETAIEAKRTMKMMADYTEKQKIVLESHKNQMAIEQGYQAAAVLHKTLELVNSKYLPKLGFALDGLTDTTRNTARVADGLDILLRNLNSTTIPKANDAIDSTSVTMKQAGQAIEAVNAGTKVLMDSIDAKINDPHIDSILASLDTSMSKVDSILANVDGMSAEAKDIFKTEMRNIAKSLDKIAKTSSQWQKPMMAANIFSLLWRAFVW